MQQKRRQVPTMDQIRTGEAAALERAAAGFRDALGAERVYAAALSDDGILRFKGAAPVGAGSPGPLEPAAVTGIAEAMATATVCDVTDARPPFVGDGRIVAIPWTAAGEVLGVGVVIMPPDVDLPRDAVLALLGAKVGSTIATMRDCDTLVHRVAELHDSADVLDRVIDAATDSMKLIDLDGHILRWNHASEALYGWSEPEVIGAKMPHVPEPLRLRAIHDIRSIAASGRTVQRESAALLRDGSSITVQMTVVPFLDGEGNPSGVLSIGRKLHTTEPGPTNADMCTLMADALGAPMASLVGYAQLLLHPDILEDPVRRARTVRAIEEHTGSMVALMDDVALVSGAGGPELLDLEPSDVAMLVTDAVGRYEQTHATASRVIIDYDSKVVGMSLDRRRMGRALAVVMGVLLEDRPDGSEMGISIVPVGAGVSLELSTLASGATVDSVTRYDTLALHIARVIVELHGGTLSWEQLDSLVTCRIALPGDTA